MRDLSWSTTGCAPTAEFQALAAGLAAGCDGPSDCAAKVCALVYDEIEYIPGSTEVHGHASDAWAARAGVCQDMAHLAIGGAARGAVPARYVSGYLHPRREPEVGETVTGESHAWIEWWDGGWIGFDPTNDVAPGDRHVVVARGRDYTDVPPLTGIFSGGSTSSMAVAVAGHPAVLTGRAGACLAQLQRHAGPPAMAALETGGEGAGAVAVPDVHAHLGAARLGLEHVHAAHLWPDRPQPLGRGRGAAQDADPSAEVLVDPGGGPAQQLGQRPVATEHLDGRLREARGPGLHLAVLA